MAKVKARTLDDYMSLPYRLEVSREDGYWAARFPELPGLVAGHETWSGLEDAIEDAKRVWFQVSIDHNDPIPEPSAESYSGSLRVRFPRSLHAQAARRADDEGVSLNTLIVTAVAKEVGQRGG